MTLVFAVAVCFVVCVCSNTIFQCQIILWMKRPLCFVLPLQVCKMLVTCAFPRQCFVNLDIGTIVIILVDACC